MVIHNIRDPKAGLRWIIRPRSCGMIAVYLSGAACLSVTLVVALSYAASIPDPADLFQKTERAPAVAPGSSISIDTPHNVDMIKARKPVTDSLSLPGYQRRHGRLVPNIVHVIWFFPNETSFRFHQLISLLSAHKFIKPDQLILWYSHYPIGPWWKFANQLIPELESIQKKPLSSIMGNPIKVPEHQSDIARIEILIKYGGIYIDLDVVVLKSFERLLSYEVSMGAESPNLLGSGIITAAPNATFLKKWLAAYASFRDDQWNEHSVVMPMELARRHPELIHVEWFSLQRPNWDEREWLYNEGKLWDWSDNLAIHLWYRMHGVEYNPDTIRTLNTTMGEIFRFVYYGKADQLLAPVER